MTTLVRVELMKLRTVRAPGAIVVVALALMAVFTLFNITQAGDADIPPLGEDTMPGILRAPAELLGFVALLGGVLAAAGEWTHHTITRTLLLTPRRGQVVVAKLLGGFLAGLLVAVAALVVGLLIATPLLSVDGAPLSAAASAEAAAATIAISGLYGLMGVGLGVLIRNQTAALVAALLWKMVAENVLPLIIGAPALYGWLPGGAADALLGRDRPDLLDPVAGGLLLAGYAVAFAVIGTALMLKRDTD